MELPSALFNPKLQKGKSSQENILYSGKMKLSSSNIKKFLIFSQKKWKP